MLKRSPRAYVDPLAEVHAGVHDDLRLELRGEIDVGSEVCVHRIGHVRHELRDVHRRERVDDQAHARVRAQTTDTRDAVIAPFEEAVRARVGHEDRARETVLGAPADVVLDVRTVRRARESRGEPRRVH